MLEKLEGKSFWVIFVIVLTIFALAGMAIGFLFGLLMAFVRYAYYSAILALVVSLLIYYKKGRR